jgi:hypothetical protein
MRTLLCLAMLLFPVVPGPSYASPSALSVSSSSTGSVSLSWTASATVGVSYDVYRNEVGIAINVPCCVYTDTTAQAGVAYSYTVRANAESVDSNAATVMIPLPTTTGATFVKIDTTTKANYSGVYGAKGSVIALGASNLPTGVTLSVTGNQTWTWASGFGGSCWYGNAPFHIIVNYTGQVALYVIDWDNQNRNETVSAIGASTQTNITNFTGGVWVVYNVVGGATFTITPNAGPNGVVGAIMFQ